jgi:hypothetical protein
MGDLKAAVLSEIRLLEKRYTRIYIDGTVGRATWDAALDIDSVTDDIWTDILYNSNRIHEIAAGWPISNPSGDAKNIASKLVFKSLDQAMRFVDNRSPIGIDKITFYFYNTSTVNGAISYSGVASLNFQRGPSQAGDSNGRAPIIYFNNKSISVPSPINVAFTDLNITNRASATSTVRASNANIADAGGPNITVGTIHTWNCRFEMFTVENGVLRFLSGNQWNVFSRPYWDGPSDTRVQDCDMYFVLDNGAQSGQIINWNAVFWGQRVEVFTRRGGPPIGNIDTPYTSEGSRSFTVDITDRYTTDVPNGVPGTADTNRKDFIIFKAFADFKYSAGAFIADETGSVLYGMSWNINLLNFNGKGLYFIQPHIPTAPFNLSLGEALFPSDDPTYSAPNGIDKKTIVTIFRSGGIVPTFFRFCQFRQGSTDDTYVSNFLPPVSTAPFPKQYQSLINVWGAEVRRFLGAARALYNDTLLEFAPGTLFNTDFRFFTPPTTTFKVDLFNASTDSSAGSGALAWADSSVTTFDVEVIEATAFSALAADEPPPDPYQPGLPSETETIYRNQPDELINPPQPIGGAA